MQERFTKQNLCKHMKNIIIRPADLRLLLLIYYSNNTLPFKFLMIIDNS